MVSFDPILFTYLFQHCLATGMQNDYMYMHKDLPKILPPPPLPPPLPPPPKQFPPHHPIYIHHGSCTIMLVPFPEYRLASENERP